MVDRGFKPVEALSQLVLQRIRVPQEQFAPLQQHELNMQLFLLGPSGNRHHLARQPVVGDAATTQGIFQNDPDQLLAKVAMRARTLGVKVSGAGIDSDRKTESDASLETPLFKNLNIHCPSNYSFAYSARLPHQLDFPLTRTLGPECKPQ